MYWYRTHVSGFCQVILGEDKKDALLWSRGGSMSATKQEETRRSVSLVEQAAVHGRKCGIKSCPCKAVKDVRM